ncbi:MAG: Ig-like domain-containing protein [Candidatus Izemoplasmatales bacterium]|jgi:hypothetical protein|nr:Ig-like domain-containing protein [bacterium]MDZ4196491.1 Ig-like domain-containing protein [Candidatus Izemoplasmatales bacterium]
MKTKTIILAIMMSILGFLLVACQSTTSTTQQYTTTGGTSSTTSTSNSQSTISTTPSTHSTTTQNTLSTSTSTSQPTTTITTLFTNPITTTSASGWVSYNASQISMFGSGTPAGTTNYNAELNEVAIWNIDASLDNYGGIQTPTMALDFSKAVIFQMNVVSVYSQYIVKLAVAGEAEYYYVLSDDFHTGLVSINVVDAMLSQKYREKNTQPDPGYQTGWKYANQVVNCSFHILAKGPDGEKQTAELIVKNISIYNNQPAITQVSIQSPEIHNATLQKLKSSSAVQLSANVLPNTSSQEVIWQSSNEAIAQVSSTGLVSFVGVGKAVIKATALMDQSKSSEIIVDVLSGYENPVQLALRLGSLQYNNQPTDVLSFMDLYYSTWGSDIHQAYSLPSSNALRSRNQLNQLIINNLFSKDNSTHVSEAMTSQIQSTAYTSITLLGNTNATVYRNINGLLVSEAYQGSLKIAYAVHQSQWNPTDSYSEYGMVVWANGEVRKYEIHVIKTYQMASYVANDFASSSLWTIPDRTKQSINPVIHALSPASIIVDQGLAVIRQNKYPEAKYNFGGLVSNVFVSTPNATVQILLDVAAINQLNNFVKTMWEIKILYYYSDGTTAVSSNPLKVASGNSIGLQDIVFTPAYSHFRIYLVCNGSDIGQQFSGAEMKIRSFVIQELDS